MNIIHWTVELRLAVALALGFLVGLQRERLRFEQNHLLLGGVRTYPLLSLFGFGCAWLSGAGFPWVLPMGLLSVTVLAGMSYLAKMRQSERFGVTTEAAALLTYVTGALCDRADIWIPMALGIITTFLLSEKAQLESVVKKLDQIEFLATVKFLLVTVIILPALPNRDYTRFEINPSEVWKLVILVSTLGFAGYLLARRFGPKVGLRLNGLLGGIVSSTAVTVASGRLARKNPSQSANAIQAAILAGSVMYLRLLVLVAIVSPWTVPRLWWRLLALAMIGFLLSLGLQRPPEAGETPAPAEGLRLQNPFELRPALVFAALFVALSVATILVKQSLGNPGLVGLSALSGLVDVDPFVLSLVRGSAPVLGMIVKAVLVAVMSNTLFKGLYIGLLAPREQAQAAWRYGLWTILHVPFLLVP